MRERRGLGQEEVRHHQQVERGQPRLDASRVRRRHGDVRPEHQERAHAAGFAHRRQHLEGRLAGARQLLLGDAPEGGDVPPRVGIVDSAVAGQLIGLLPVLASALAVALAGHAAVAAGRSPDLAERQREVDVGERVVDAVRLLLRARGR